MCDILSDCEEPCQSVEDRLNALEGCREKKFLSPRSDEKFRDIVRFSSPLSQCFHTSNRKVYNLYE